MTDDDLRFGDINGGGGGDDILDWFVKIITILIMGYVVLVIAESLFEIPIPFV